MSTPIPFPAGLPDFLEVQERLTGRPLSDAEKALMGVWWPLIADADQETIAAVDELIAQRHSDEWMNKFLTAVKKWMEVRHEAGDR